MANAKISALNSASTPLAGTEVLPIVQGGETVKVAVDSLTAGKAVATGALTVTGAATISSTLGVTGTTALTGALAANGGITVDTTAFTVADTTGNVATTGTLTVGGVAALNGGLTMDTDKFTVENGTGNTVVAGTLGVTGATTLTGHLTVEGVTSTGATGSGAIVFGTGPTLSAPVLGTPASGTLSACTGYPTANLTGLGSGVATFLATPSSANLATAVTGETGSGALVFGTSPTIATPVLSLRVTTAAALGAIANAINTTGKAQGTLVYNSDDNLLYVANGAAAADTWSPSDGGTAITPA